MLPMKPMSESNELKRAEEVRHGLFRFKWLIGDQIPKNGVNKETFQLCGSEKGRTFTIDYCFKKFGNQYSKTFTVEETLCNSNSTSRERKGIDSTAQNQQQLSDSLHESPICRKKQKNDPSPSPLFVWFSKMKKNKTFKSEEDFLHLKFSWLTNNWKFTWNGPTCSFGVISVWIDFGMSSVKQRNIMNTMNELTEMFNDQTCCDVQFLFKNGESIDAHILILSAGSPVFRAMFRLGFKESQTRQVTIDDIKLDVFRELLIYFYSGDAPKLRTFTVNLNTIQLLFEVADKYAVETLKKECVIVLSKQLNRKNVVDLLVWSHFHSITELFDIAMKFLTDNFRFLSFQPEWSDFLKNHPDLCLEATRRISALLPISSESTI